MGYGQCPAGESETCPDVEGARRILIVEDQQLVADALAFALSGQGFEGRVAIPTTFEAVLHEARSFAPDLVLVDLDIRGVDGLELIAPLEQTGAVVLVVTGSTDAAPQAAALAEGAVGWVAKYEAFGQLVDAVRAALQKRCLLPPDSREELAALGRRWLVRERELASRLAWLTDRESEVLEALYDGKNAHDIASEFVLSVGTVRTHIRAILFKLGVSTQLAAVAKARKARPSRVSYRPLCASTCRYGGIVSRCGIGTISNIEDALRADRP